MAKITSLKDMRPKTKTFQLHSALDKDDLLTDANDQPIMIEIVGYDSAVFRDAAIESARTELNSEVKDTVDPMFRAEKNLRLAAACIVGWTAPEVLGEYSKERALEICLDGDLKYIVEQIQEAISDRKSFFAN
ncbi:hypothetical protein QTI05_24120 [Variovorax sp. J22R193]|uniref:hypothetical protein n=1 Tax=Variovorax fucosicus TaxID=3053517 RepID=UPI00257509F2|nr:hypothetical protein [Variovorax sp. J22R193]MDM0042146.1 hypothetical protein [Variovorax sp. J22R193]